MYNQSFMNNNFQQSQFGGGAQNSQYQGLPKFQPTGFVNSVYGQSQGQGQFGQSQGNYGQSMTGYATSQFQPSGSITGYQQQQQQAPQSFHTNSYVRSDNPVLSHLGLTSSNNSIGNASYASQASYMPQSAQSFHMSGYRGNQPGHDTQLHNTYTSNQQNQYGSGSFGQNQGSYASASTFQPTYQQQSQQSFHTAGYRGDQQGHDIRNDSSYFTPYGGSSFGSFTR
ncbi:hypothetical protein [Paenibacillus sp. MBLB4367]|uniref:hypothetical protein n=1 Tax=Paenibacillus sp. MBLB4367 TaxID=3384767 RepID=UPI00390825ED